MKTLIIAALVVLLAVSGVIAWAVGTSGATPLARQAQTCSCCECDPCDCADCACCTCEPCGCK